MHHRITFALLLLAMSVAATMQAGPTTAEGVEFTCRKGLFGTRSC
jgi:hypothetical protein